MTGAQVDAAQRDRLAAALQHSLPDRPELQLLELVPLGAGWETSLYRAVVRFTEPTVATTEQWVLRGYQGPGHRNRASSDFELLRRLQSLRIPVPAVLQVVDEDTEPGSSWLVMEYLPGPNLRQRIRELPDQSILVELHRMAALLSDIHRASWRQALPEAEPESPADVVEGMQATVQRLQLTEFGPHLAWLERRQPQISEPPVLLHNDFHPENLLVKAGELVAIDWSFAAAGDYRMDLAWTVLLVGSMLGDRFRDPMLHAYQQRRGTPVEHFEYFEVLKLGNRLLTILTWLDERVDIPIPRISRRALHGAYKVHILNPYRRLVELTGLELPSIEAL